MTNIYNLRNLPEIQHQDISRSEQKTAWQNTWQNIKSVLKTVPRVIAGIATFGASEGIIAIIKLIIPPNGVKVEPRAGEANLISVNKSLKREISDFLNSDAYLDRQKPFSTLLDHYLTNGPPSNYTRLLASTTVLKQSLNISDETLSHISLKFMEDCDDESNHNQSRKIIGESATDKLKTILLKNIEKGIIDHDVVDLLPNIARLNSDYDSDLSRGFIGESVTDKLKTIVNLCTENGMIDHGAIELLTKIANKSSQDVILNSVTRSFFEKGKNYIYVAQQQPDTSFTINSEKVNGRKEYVVVGYCKTELFDTSKDKNAIAKGFQTYKLRIKQDETGAWKAYLEDAKHYLKPEAGYSRADIKIESSKIREGFKNNIGDSYTSYNKQQITNEIIKKTPEINDKQAEIALELVPHLQKVLKSFNTDMVSTKEMFDIFTGLKQKCDITFQKLNPDPKKHEVPTKVFLAFALEVAIKTGNFSQDDKQRIYNTLISENGIKFFNSIMLISKYAKVPEYNKNLFESTIFPPLNLRLEMVSSLMNELGIKDMPNSVAPYELNELKSDEKMNQVDPDIFNIARKFDSNLIMKLEIRQISIK